MGDRSHFQTPVPPEPDVSAENEVDFRDQLQKLHLCTNFYHNQMGAC